MKGKTLSPLLLFLSLLFLCFAVVWLWFSLETPSLSGFFSAFLLLPLPSPPAHPTSLSSVPSRGRRETRSGCLWGSPAVIEPWASSAAGPETRAKGRESGEVKGELVDGGCWKLSLGGRRRGTGRPGRVKTLLRAGGSC